MVGGRSHQFPGPPRPGTEQLFADHLDAQPALLTNRDDPYNFSS